MAYLQPNIDCKQSLFFFGIVERSARFAIHLRDCERRSREPRGSEGGSPLSWRLRPRSSRLAIAHRALPSTIQKKNNDCSHSKPNMQFVLIRLPGKVSLAQFWSLTVYLLRSETPVRKFVHVPVTEIVENEK